MNELNELDLRVLLRNNYANAFEFFAACSNNLTLDYNIRKAVHRTVYIYRNFVVYNATVGLAQARPNKYELLNHPCSGIQPLI